MYPFSLITAPRDQRPDGRNLDTSVYYTLQEVSAQYVWQCGTELFSNFNNHLSIVMNRVFLIINRVLLLQCIIEKHLGCI